MKDRINWIDWAKVVAIAFVVFGHVPETKGSFLQNYVTTYHMPLFIFISGYLTKQEFISKATLKKYWHSLIVPYFLYNLIFYPYWLVRHFMEHGTMEISDCLRPLTGTLLLQLYSPISEPLSGVTWFLLALLIMKIILATCNHLRCGHLIMVLLSAICLFIYTYFEFHGMFSNLLTMNFSKCLPFYYIGYLCRKHNLLPVQVSYCDKYMFACGFIFSLIVFYFFSSDKTGGDYPLHFLFVYANSFFFICWVLCLCRLMDGICIDYIQNISIGTIVIMGFHWMLIGVINFLMVKLLHQGQDIVYPWYIAIFLSLAIIAMLYPVIILCKRKFPIMLGKRTL